MTTFSMYRCDCCGQSFERPDGAMACEAGHYSLSMDEYAQWKALCKKAAEAGRSIGHAKNPRTDAAFDEACRELTDFETVHDLDDAKKPSDFYF